MQVSPFVPLILEQRIVADKIDVYALVQTLLKDSECTDPQTLLSLAQQVQGLRMSFRSINQQNVDDCRKYISVCVRLSQAIPWGSPKIMKLIKPGFQYSYAQNAKHILAPEQSLMMDALAGCYNCACLYTRSAQQQQDLKTRAQELAKASYYSNLALQISKNNATLLGNVCTHFGQSFFLALNQLLEAQCAETQAILRAQRSDLIGSEAAFEQFIGLMSYAETCYKKADGLLLGIQAPGLKEFANKRLQSTMQALLYVNASHIATKNPSQALKDAMSAQDLKGEFVDFGTIQNLIMSLMSARTSAAPQASKFKPVPTDLSAKYVEWGIVVDINTKDELFMITKSEMEIIKLIIEKAEVELTAQACGGPMRDRAAQGNVLGTEIEQALQTDGAEEIIKKLQKLNNVPNIRQRLVNGANFDIIIQNLNTSTQAVIQIFNQVLMADADNIRRYGAQRWNSAQAMNLIRNEVEILTKIAGILGQQQQCIDYMKQYHDNEYHELFGFAQTCSSIQFDEELKTKLAKKMQELRTAAQQGLEPPKIKVSLMEAYSLVSSREITKKNIKELAQIVVEKMQGQQKDTTEIDQILLETSQLFDEYKRKAPLTAAQISNFQNQIQLITNIMTTIESGEQFTENTTKQVELAKAKATDWLQKYRSCIETQFPLMQQGAVLNILLQ
ncbi:Conserved_hypothetical protein [Hexamita inflata]|uniref:BRO1 domain-containing protein n=1 Tax=Hexamita inflata TaxID=28002 RepID=A0AA86QEM0_9EUKA|nr:Conserved hypothetical protein [Hexamita inflata]